MLLELHSLRELPQDALPTLYGITEGEKQAAYLRDVFFSTPGAVLFLWQDGGRSVSAVRAEPYLDGLLLSGLQTAEEARRMGYASSLLGALRGRGVKLYSHVCRSNRASRALHRKCGFRVIADYARMIDGTVTSAAVTLCAAPVEESIVDNQWMQGV